jgi:hypothetical protein
MSWIQIDLYSIISIIWDDLNQTRDTKTNNLLHDLQARHEFNIKLVG